MSSLILYSKASYLGTSLPVTHGQTGELASAAALDYLSVGIEAMNLFCWSSVNTASAIDYQLHEESLISASIADLSSLYPQGQTQYPMSYLGIDPARAVPVWLDMSQVSGSTNAVASTSLVGDSTTSITTLSRTGDEGVLAFIGLAGGSAVAANCLYGSYDEATGLVDWAAGGAGTIVLEYTGGAVVSLSATGFPDSWTFGDPKAQADGSWMIAVSGTASGNVISDLSASKETLVNNGTDSVTLTATVTDNGQPVSGTSVSWETALGTIAPSSSTDTHGQATATLTDTGDKGATTVTASLSDGSFRDITITLTDGASGQTIVSLNSDPDSIENDGSDAARLTATVHNADGSVAEGVTVYWSTTLGELNHASKDTAADGTSGVKLTDLGDTGTATVTASLKNGQEKNVQVDIVKKKDVEVFFTTDAFCNTSKYVQHCYVEIFNHGTKAVDVELSAPEGILIDGRKNTASYTVDPGSYSYKTVISNEGAGVFTINATVDNVYYSGDMTFMEADLSGDDQTDLCVNSNAPGDGYGRNNVGAATGKKNTTIILSVDGNGLILVEGEKYGTSWTGVVSPGDSMHDIDIISTQPGIVNVTLSNQDGEIIKIWESMFV
jgi:hypothetical protein